MHDLDSLEKVKKGFRIYARESREAYEAYLKEMLREDQLAAEVLEVVILTYISDLSAAVRKGTRLYRNLSGDLRLSAYLASVIGRAYRMMGEMEASDSSYIRACEIAEELGDKQMVMEARMGLLFNRFFKGEYEEFRRASLQMLGSSGLTEEQRDLISFYMSVLEPILGEPNKALGVIDSLVKRVDSRNPIFLFGLLENRGFALILCGKVEDAFHAFLESAEGYCSISSAYSAFPLAKALELHRLFGLEPPPRDLIKKCLALAKKGSWGEEAAAQEVKALMIESPSEAASALLEAARGYLRAHQNIEALCAGLISAYFSWNYGGSSFVDAVRLIAPLIPLHPGLRRFPVLGEFFTGLEQFLACISEKRTERLRAHLIGELRVWVGDKEIPVQSWYNKNALRALVYLLLSHHHRIPKDHLLFLLWPKENPCPKVKQWLYVPISFARQRLGRPELITSKRDFYQLEDVWTDLGELENLMRLADATRDPA